MPAQLRAPGERSFRPAINRAIAWATGDLVIDFFNKGELSLSDGQIEAIRLLPMPALNRLQRGLPQQADPMSFLNAALGHSPPVSGKR